MRNYLLVLNGAAIADFFRRGNAENSFRRWMNRIGCDDVLVLFELSSGRTIASSI